MTTKQGSPGKKKEGVVNHVERNSVAQQAELALKEAKKQAGSVVHIAISDRTTIELPAHLSQEERDARVANYLKLHKSSI